MDNVHELRRNQKQIEAEFAEIIAAYMELRGHDPEYLPKWFIELEEAVRVSPTIRDQKAMIAKQMIALSDTGPLMFLKLLRAGYVASRSAELEVRIMNLDNGKPDQN